MFILKKLIKGLFKLNGINFSGKKICRYKGAGHKKNYRILNFFYNVWNLTGIIKQLSYDPIKQSYIFLVCFQNGLFFYKLAIYNVKIGFYIRLGNNVYINNGNSLYINKIPLGINICCLSLETNQIMCFLRASGCFGKILQNKQQFVLIKLNSTKNRFFFFKCLCTIGRVANITYFLLNLRKAGRSIWLNKKPCVRGIAMNPIDHPNGGNTSGKHYRSIYSTLYKGKKTRKKKKYSIKYII